MHVTTIHPSWKSLFEEFSFTLEEDTTSRSPSTEDDIFKIFQLPVDEIRVVLIGKEPFEGYKNNGLAYSVEAGERIPSATLNLFKELSREYPERRYKFTHGDLTRWVLEEGIFLLNTALTVEPGKSHVFSEWQDFTDEVIRNLSRRNLTCVFLLLDNHAKSKKHLIKNAHLRCVEIPKQLRMSGGPGVFRKVESILGYEINWSL